MIQDIAPSKLHNEYRHLQQPADTDIVFFFQKGKILSRERENFFPDYHEIVRAGIEKAFTYQYLFAVDAQHYFWAKPREEDSTGPLLEQTMPEYAFVSIQVLRGLSDAVAAYAGVTAYHLFQWYIQNRFCPCCAASLEHDTRERMLHCPSCGKMIYPRINPSVIVAVVDQDRLLVTRYASQNAYRKYALVAGFTEIGETMEETVAREVLEETGLHVKDIQYYKSQPWGFTGGILLGYWARLDGEDTIRLDISELCEGKWVAREEVPLDESHISLTCEMMHRFQQGKEPYK